MTKRRRTTIGKLGGYFSFFDIAAFFVSISALFFNSAGVGWIFLPLQRLLHVTKAMSYNTPG
ncbi:hypothetical protein BDV26DRAFT_274545 [Aspergillus bertholletiae]|uniref:Uncharacterized protein n=1 Tax=Aspergillus bertholletiae TaxID=1226010 RepID=A0A5N7AQX7_9EURO|nr:hypothetical protein BDV26DRAFT_274545 [Aspergillus bertholletiae]